MQNLVGLVIGTMELLIELWISLVETAIDGIAQAIDIVIMLLEPNIKWNQSL